MFSLCANALETDFLVMKSLRSFYVASDEVTRQSSSARLRRR